MTNDDPAKARLSKFSNADRRAYTHPQKDTPLADLLEHAIRDSGLGEHVRPGPADGQMPPRATEPETVPVKLIEELTTAQEQILSAKQLEHTEPPLTYAEPPILPETPLEEPVPAAFDAIAQAAAPSAEAIPSADPAGSGHAAAGAALGALGGDAASREASHRKRPGGVARTALAKGAKAVADASRRMRARDWRRRRLALLSIVHRHVFDRKTEQLLFCKSPPLEVYQVDETQSGLEKSFVYEGPIPRKLLDWALSALPDNLKRYAFVDFRAGNGRTLLLAARRNFEYAAGYAYDAAASETLEMNLAQYPRSYLSCRDVRALRGDRDGVHIPSQPAVLFFPDGVSEGCLDVLLSHVKASLRLDPRPIYLIFENAGRERGREQMKMFEKAPLPLLNQAKAVFFAPIKIAVYRFKSESPA